MMKHNPLSKLELVLIVTIIILCMVSIGLFAVWKVLIPSLSIEDIASNQPTFTPAVDTMTNLTPIQQIEDSSDIELPPTQIADDSTETQPTPTQYTEEEVVDESAATPVPTIEDTLNSKSTSPLPMWWWNDDFFYRQSLTLNTDADISYDPTITQVVKLEMDLVELVMDDEGNMDKTKLRPDGEGLVIVYWDGSDWSNLPINVQLEPDEVNMKLTTTIYFPLQNDVTDTTGGYWFYYGNFVRYPTPLLIEPYRYASKSYTEVEGETNEGEFNLDFHTDSVVGLVPLTVPLTYFSFPEANEFQWDFGDGEISPSLPGAETDLTITHTYDEPGIYTPTLIANFANNDGEPVAVTRVYPGLIWVAGVDLSDQIMVQLNGDEETPIVTATLPANPDTTHVITSAEGVLTVSFPPNSLKETLVVSHVPYRATLDQGKGTLARFSIMAETLGGQPVTQPDQPMILTLDMNRFFDLSDARSRAMAETIAFFGWEEATEEWEHLDSVSFDLEQGSIVYELDRFDRPVQIYVTGMPGDLPPIR